MSPPLPSKSGLPYPAGVIVNNDAPIAPEPVNFYSYFNKVFLVGIIKFLTNEQNSGFPSAYRPRLSSVVFSFITIMPNSHSLFSVMRTFCNMLWQQTIKRYFRKLDSFRKFCEKILGAFLLNF